ncbi:hypothetical protein A2U01_0094596, partial [Trifolium medium]|nr:hypothetical protein [Trifolium medium]
MVWKSSVGGGIGPYKGLVVKEKVIACLKPEDKVEDVMVVRVMAALGSKVLDILGLETVEVTA